MTNDFLDDIQRRIETFDKLLDRCGMDHKKYQEDGVRWCLTNELRTDHPVEVRGGFIADEMGLGKTILMIGTFVANMMTKNLIILPPVLIDQWVQQIRRITGHSPIVFHGKNKKNITIDHLNKSVIVISTYSAISVTKNNKRSLLHQVKWNRIVFDEGHHLRNKTTILTGAILLKAKIRWIVSGTPIQNKKSDFYNLCKALKMPNSFYTNPDNLILIARHYILKRTKKNVGIILPEVTIENEIVHWKSNKEKTLSEGIHWVLGMAADDKMNRIGEIIKNQSGSILRAFLRARQCCTLPKIMNKMFDEFVKDGYINNYDSYKEALSFSSKLDAVIDTILKNKGNGCGKLVFCHFREEIDEIQKRLQLGGIDKIACFDGRLTQNVRQDILEDNNEVLILQIQTGCEGLNLQENYSEIYFVSPHWNPSVEDQAVARCHRIGQVKEVKVYKFQMDNFNEERNPVDSMDKSMDKSIDKSIDKYVGEVQDNKRLIANEVIA